MIWRQKTSYRGTREYDEDPQSGATISQTELTVAWLLGAVRRRFGWLARLPELIGPSRTTLTILNHRGFTLLGMPDGAPGTANEATPSRDR